MPAGRPSKYKPEYVEQARNYCALGATDAEIAKFLDVNEATVNRWKTRYPEFCEALKDGKMVADAAVTESLFRRATGYSHEYEKIFVHEGEPVRVATTKHYPPDTTACIFWLKNRRPQLWRDKQEVDLNHGAQDSLAELMKKINGKSRGLPNMKLVGSSDG